MPIPRKVRDRQLNSTKHSHIVQVLRENSNRRRHFGGLPKSTKTAPIDLRVEVHDLPEAKMVYLNSQVAGFINGP
eukprot:gene1825-biopygen1241